jgi:hypothetical protein
MGHIHLPLSQNSTIVTTMVFSNLPQIFEIFYKKEFANGSKACSPETFEICGPI